MCEESGGVVVGIVQSLEDGDRLGRVRVTFPHLEDQESELARLATLMAGPDRGAFFRPEPGDEVLVAFEHNDPRRPYVIGSLWSKVDQPPADDGRDKNNWRFFKSRSGHLIKLDDTDGAEKIELVDKDGKHTVAVDSGANSIRVVSDSGDVTVTADAGSVTVTAKTVQIDASQQMTLSAGGKLTIRGATVEINP
jgi:uncharacterized protein involved in type VI secretion and phage assembly